MPSSLGTSAGGGQEGYDPAAATASSTTANTTNTHNTDIALQELNNKNTLQVSRASTDANRLSAVHLNSAAATLDGTRDSNEIGGREAIAHVRVDPALQDSVVHDHHIRTEAANVKGAEIKRESGVDTEMNDQIPAATAVSAQPATPQIAGGDSLENLEKNAQQEPSASHVERTPSTDEKLATPSQVTPAAVTTPIPATTSSPSATSSPETQQRDSAPVLNIILLLPTGARHAFRIAESYLTKRGVSIPGTDDKGNKDVYSVSVYQIKELILREWKEEWSGETTVGPLGENAEVEAGRMRGKPSSPAAIRLIFFGRLLGDGDKVEDCRFNKTSPNVVHMTVRPQDVVDEEETERKRNEGRGSRRGHPGGEEATPGCRCVIM